MSMPSSVNGGTWLSGDTIGKAAANLKGVLDISFATYSPAIGTDTVAGQLVIDSNGCVLYVVNAANNAYGIAINQSLRTTDSPTFVNLNLTGHINQNSLPYQFNVCSVQGLVLYFPMDEGSGSTVYDISGNGNKGTLSGSPIPSWVNGKYGGALSFDGANSYVTVPSNAQLNSVNVSVSVWFQRVGSLGVNYTPIVGKWNGNWIFYLMSSNLIEFFIKCPDATEPYAVSTTVFNDLNVWHYVVGTYDGANIKLYVDGVLQGTTPNTLGMVTGSSPVNIGKDQVTDYFNGLIDDVRIYNRALSATEVLSIYQNGALLIPESLINQSVAIGSSPTFLNITATGTVSGSGWYNSSPSISAPTRQLNTVYQNTTGKTIVVYVMVLIGGNAVAQTNIATLELAATSGGLNTTQVGEFNNSTLSSYYSLNCIVPNNWYYTLSTVGAVFIFQWWEMPL